jgi:hypothetical protein
LILVRDVIEVLAKLFTGGIQAFRNVVWCERERVQGSRPWDVR